MKRHLVLNVSLVCYIALANYILIHVTPKEYVRCYGIFGMFKASIGQFWVNQEIPCWEIVVILTERIKNIYKGNTPY